MISASEKEREWGLDPSPKPDTMDAKICGCTSCFDRFFRLGFILADQRCHQSRKQKTENGKQKAERRKQKAESVHQRQNLEVSTIQCFNDIFDPSIMDRKGKGERGSGRQTWGASTKKASNDSPDSPKTAVDPFRPQIRWPDTDDRLAYRH